jgi:pseudaminic acid biosynthesis-associated methylase
MGFSDLWGIEISQEAFELAKTNTKNINVIRCSAFEIPFKDDFFDLVYTSGVLIHINPTELDFILNNIYRLSKQWIWGFEYYSGSLTPVSYRGKEGLMWKNNFLKCYLEKFPNLRSSKEKKLKYTFNDNVDHMFLLEKES